MIHPEIGSSGVSWSRPPAPPVRREVLWPYILPTLGEGGLFLFLCLLFTFSSSNAQRSMSLHPDIATLRVTAGNRWTELPVTTLNGHEPIHIEFDELSHQYKRYAYRIEHCEADWTTSDELLTSDFVEGFPDGSIIEDYTQSINTNQPYTHYHLTIPNESCRLKMGGNYRVTIYDDNEDTEVVSACFMILDEKAALFMEGTTNTDLTVNRSHQQIAMTLNYSRLRVVNPSEQIKTVVMQNKRWDNSVSNAAPQHIMADGLQWSHNKDLIFAAGNEYRKYEILDLTHATLGIDRIAWDGDNYHVFPYTDEPRRNYVYDEDADGASYIRNSDNFENDYSTDYAFVHYRLACPSPVRGEVYVSGDWTNGHSPQLYKMTYDEAEAAYFATIYQKQGYYNYQYLLMKPDGQMVTMPGEGDFYQTENTYDALVYYRAQGERYDNLVAHRTIKVK